MNKKTLIWLVVILLVVVVAVYFLVRRKAGPANQPAQTNTQNAQQNAAPAAAPANTAKRPAPPPPSAKYQQALTVYGSSGYRFQFSDCHGYPGKLVIKQNQKLMLDNRDPGKHTIVVKSQTFKVAGYDFAIATAKDLGTYNITCDGGGAAELTVER